MSAGIPRSNIWAGAGIVFLAALAVLPWLAQPSMTRQQELRVALVGRDMAQGGSWLIPHFQREVRLKKPPLSYWTAATSYRIFGDTRSAFAARLPTALFGILLMLAVWRHGNRLFGRGAGWWAAVVGISCICFIRHARLAETDIPSAACIAWALWFGFAALKENRWRDWLMLGACAGLGFLAKGLAALAIPPIVLLGTVLIDREARAGLSRWRFGTVAKVVGTILLFGLIAAPWYIYVMRYQAGQAAISSELNAALGNTKHPGSPLYYVYTLPIQLLPWGLLLPWAVWRLIQSPASRAKAFAIAWLAGTFVLLSTISSKQSHYTVLLLAPSALVLGAALHHWIGGTKARARLCHCVAGALLISAIAWQGFIAPKVDAEERLAGFLERCRGEISAGEKIHAVGVNSAIFEFYLGELVHNTEHLDDAWARAGTGDVILFAGKAAKEGSGRPANRFVEDPNPPVFAENPDDWRYRFYRK